MTNQAKLMARYQKHHTSHVLHLLLSVLTAGLWVPVWLLVAVSNANERQKIEKKLGRAA